MKEDTTRQMEEEYQRLDSEIEINSKKVFDLIKLMLTVTITILSLGFTKWLTNYELVFLIPIFLIVPISLLIESQISATERIASYMRVYLEPNIKGYNWESNLKKYRSVNKNKSKLSFSIVTIAGGLGALCYFLYVIQLINNSSIDIYRIATYWDDICAVAVTFILLRYCINRLNRAKTKAQELDERWESALKTSIKAED